HAPTLTYPLSLHDALPISGGNNPSKPSRKPKTSQPSLSAARTTPRKTAFNPGQSPPLVKTPIRGLLMGVTKSERFLWIDPTTGRDRKSTRLNSSHVAISYA